MRAKARLEDLFVTRVDAVSAPANRRRFLMLKEEVEDMPETAVQEVERQGLTAEQTEKIKRALELLYPLFEEGVLPDSVIATLAQLVGYPLPAGVKPYPAPAPEASEEASEEATKKTEAVVCEATSEGSVASAETTPKAAVEEQTPKEDVPESAPVAKAAKPAAPSIELEELRKTREELEALKKALAEERAAREKREFEEAIKSEMPSLLTLAPDLVDVLFSLRKSGNEKTLESLKKLEAVIAASPLFKELGSQGPAEESPWDVLDREARALLEKGEAKTIEAARVMVLSKDPELYKKLRG